jgi:hypothetical protein
VAEARSERAAAGSTTRTDEAFWPGPIRPLAAATAVAVPIGLGAVYAAGHGLLPVVAAWISKLLHGG